MTLKIHVLYQGIVYRVRGIKVLCSVVLAVIILLVAIVCMGAWMLVTAYNTDPKLVPINATSTEAYQTGDIKIVGVNSQSTENEPNNQAVNKEMHYLDNVNGISETIEHIVRDDGQVSTTTDKVLRLNYSDQSVSEEPFNYDDGLLSPLVFPIPADDERGKHFVYDEVFTSQKRLRNQQKDSNGSILLFAENPPFGIRESYLELAKKKLQLSNEKNNPANGNKSEELQYKGPPVVGYGKNPYDKLPTQRIESFEKVWDTFTRKKSNVNPNLTKVNRRTGYPKRRLKPPSILMQAKQLENRPKAGKPKRPILRPSSNLNHRRPLKRTKLRSKLTPPRMKTNPKSILKLNIKTGSKNVAKSFQNLYNYSRKLANTMMELATNDQFTAKNTIDFITKNGIELIGAFHGAFNAKNGSIPSVESIMANGSVHLSNTIDISLKAWTFLDYWEFLLKKICSLSKYPDESLRKVEKNLDNLKENKDIAMTWYIVNQTIQYISNKTHSSTKKRKNKIVLPVMPRGLNRNISKDLSVATAAIDLLKEMVSNMPNHNDTEEPNIYNALPLMYKTNISTTDNTSYASNASHLMYNANISTTDNASYVSNVANDRNSFIDNPTALKLTDLNSSERRFNIRDVINDPNDNINIRQFMTRIIYNFGKLYSKIEFNGSCTMLLFCKNLNKNAQLAGMQGIPAKLKSVGLQVLSEKELRHSDTFGEIFRAVTSWKPMQCDSMFPKCDGERALEIVNEVAHGTA